MLEFTYSVFKGEDRDGWHLIGVPGENCLELFSIIEGVAPEAVDEIA